MLGSVNESKLFEKCLGKCQSKVRADKLVSTGMWEIWKSQCKCTAEINLVFDALVAIWRFMMVTIEINLCHAVWLRDGAS